MSDGKEAAGSSEESNALNPIKAKEATKRKSTGEEDDSGAILALRGEIDFVFDHDPAEEFVRHLHENTGPVAGLGLCSARAPMIHIGVHRERLLDDVMRSLPFEMGDESDATGVLLVGGMPEALGLGPS